MFDHPWFETTIGRCLVDSFAGEWGDNPPPANARVLRAADINNDGQVNPAGGAPRRIPANKLVQKKLRYGDIILEGSGGSPDQPVGRVAFFDGKQQGEFVCSNFFRTLRPNPIVVDQKFLFWKLMWFYKQPTLLTLQQQTTGLINLKFNEYKNALISIPEMLAEQQQIATLLDELDSTIKKTEAIIDKLKQLKQGLLHDLLTRGVDDNGELRPSFAEAPHLYHPTPVGQIPTNWNCKILGDIATSVIDGPFGSNLKTSHYVAEAGVRVVRLQNIQPGTYDDTERVFVSAKHAAVLVRNQVGGGDVLIASLGDNNNPVGRACCYPTDFPDAINKADCFRFRGNSDCINEFIMYFMNGQVARAQIRSYEQGVTLKRINVNNLRKILVALPPKNEQATIIERLAIIAKQESTVICHLNKLQNERSGLMADLLTGRVRVTPLLAGASA